MNKEKDFFKTCFNTVAGIEVKNESQAIAKEVVLSEIENLQQENKQLKENNMSMQEEMVRTWKKLDDLEQIEQEHQKINGELRGENKKYKEVIDKAINNSQYWIDYYTRLNSDERIALRLQENIDILKDIRKKIK